MAGNYRKEYGKENIVKAAEPTRRQAVNEHQDRSIYQIPYRQAKVLLQEKLYVFFRLNRNIRVHLTDLKRFVEVSDQLVKFNLNELSQGYRFKFVDPDSEKYCTMLLDKLQPVLIDFLREVHYGGHAFKFVFSINGREDLVKYLAPRIDEEI